MTATSAHRHRHRTRSYRVRSSSDASLAPSGSIEQMLLSVVDLGLVATVFLVPLILGGRVALGQFVLVALALGVTVCWTACQSLRASAVWRRSATTPLLVVVVLLIGLQLVCLPAGILQMLSPKIAQILPMWGAAGDTSITLGTWSTISLTPAATRDALILVVAFVLLFITASQRVRETADVERLLRWMAIATVVLAVQGLAQRFVSNGKFLWCYDHACFNPDMWLSGSFTNRNHFAQFIALGVGPLIWWLFSGFAKPERHRHSKAAGFGNSATVENDTWLRAMGLGIAVFAGLLSLSRGGAIAMLVAMLVSLAILYWAKMVGRRMMLGLSGAGLLVAVGLLIFGHETVTQRLESFGSMETLDGRAGRRQIWTADLKGIADYAAVGTGLGSHREVYPMYLANAETSQRMEFTHAENGYIQTALEGGAAGLFLVLIAGGLCGYWCFQALKRDDSRRTILCVAAIAGSLAASFVHSLFDFVWYIPGCMVVPVLLAACIERLSQPPSSQTDYGDRGDHDESPDATSPATAVTLGRPVWIVATGLLVFVGFFLLQNRLAVLQAEPYWNRYLVLSRTVDRGRELEDERASLEAIVGQLEQVVRRLPDHTQAHAKLAAVHLRLFDYHDATDVCPMTLQQVRDAVNQSQFESTEAIRAWIGRAFAERGRHLYAALEHAHRAVRCNPLDGEAYVYLADLAFLEGCEGPGTAAYIAQGLKVRPYHGDVLFSAGLLAGEPDRALELWKASFHAGRVHQQRLIKLLAPQLSADFLVETFQPDARSLGYVVRCYQDRGEPEQLAIARRHYANACIVEAQQHRGAEATDWLLKAAAAFGGLEQIDAQLQCLQEAVNRDTTHYQAHYQLGRCLHKSGRHQEAATHLQWCLQRRPKDQKLRKLVEAAIKGGLRMTGLPAEDRR